jgi:sugar phosphate isomerase/epimerase
LGAKVVSLVEPKTDGMSEDVLRYSVDLITFYDPQSWGVDSIDQLNAFAKERPNYFWSRMLDTAATAGLSGIETTFSPFHWQDAVSAFGSVDRFSTALAERRLSVSSGFFSDLAHGADIESGTGIDSVCDAAARYADFIAAGGGDALVVGLPLRRSRDTQPPLFVDFELAHRYADILNRIGARTIASGARVALHTEAHSICADTRDVDLFMLLTDPVYVGLCPDTAHLLVSGSDPVAVAMRHVDRIVTAHWKDATGRMPAGMPIDEQIYERHQPYFCRLGAGAVDWPAWARLYRDHNLGGWVILELDAAADPLEEIRASRRFVGAAMGAILGRRHAPPPAPLQRARSA